MIHGWQIRSYYQRLGRHIHSKRTPERSGPVWTGSEMIVWGGLFFDGSDHYLNSGGKYNPNTNTWTATSTANAPDGRTFTPRFGPAVK